MIWFIGLLLLFAGGGGLVVAALDARAGERALHHRVDAIASAALRQAGARKPPAISVWFRPVLDGTRSLFAFHMRRSWGVSGNPVHLLAAGSIGAAAIWLLSGVAHGLPGYAAPAGAAVAFFLVPRVMLIREQRRSDRQFGELLPDAIDMVVRIVRAGLPVAVAMRTVSQESDAPLSTVFVEIADQIEIGMPLDEAMAKVSEIVGNPDFRFFAVAVALQQSTGGNLTVTLETLSQIIRRRRAVRQRARAATSEVRISAIVLGSIPFFVTGALLLVAPDYLDPLFADPRGNVIVGLALLGLLLAGFTMRAMIRNILNT